MVTWIIVVAFIIWIYVLTVLKRGKIDFWYFVVGSAGLFVFAIVSLQPLLLEHMQNMVAAVSGLFGYITKTYDSYFDKGLIFISHNEIEMALHIDLECSGIIETTAFLALLWFFPVYRFYEKIVVSLAGIIAIFLANVLRIFIICQMVYYGGTELYFMAHSFVGRIVFYACTIFLYFRVFTRSQVRRQKVGAFNYENN